MKAIKCEMCDSTDIIKENGYYKCQFCGTKYTIDEAKELYKIQMYNATPDIDNLYLLARRAKAEQNAENAQKYYEQITAYDPTSWEAYFYSIYYKVFTCKIHNISIACAQISKCEKTVLELIQINETQDTVKALEQLRVDIWNCANLVTKVLKSDYESIDINIRRSYFDNYYHNMYSAVSMLYDLGDQIDSVFIGRYTAKEALICWKYGVILNKRIKFYRIDEFYNHYIDKIRQYDPEFEKT